MAAGKCVVVLIAHANRCGQPFGQRHRGRDRAPDHHARAVQDHRELRLRQQLRGLGHRRVAARGTLELDDRGQRDIHDLGKVIPRHVDLRRGRLALGLQDHTVQHLGHAGRVAHLLLVADHVLEQRHLFDFLEPAHADGLVRGLRGDQQQGRVVPVGGLDRRDKVGDAGPVLRDHHAHPARGAGEPVRHHPARAFVGAVPEPDARPGEKVTDRHEGRPDDPEGVLDPVQLQDLHKGFFGRHPHRGTPPAWTHRSALTSPALGPVPTAR